MGDPIFFGDREFIALIEIDFIDHQETTNWIPTGEKDFIPCRYEGRRGTDLVTVTEAFCVAYAGEVS